MADKEFSYTSLCKVKAINKKDIVTLQRLADLIDDKFQTDFYSSAPLSQELKSKIKNCRLSINSIAVFDWRIKQNYKKSDKYYFDIKFSNKVPIEVCILNDCRNQNDLRNKLLSGINFQFSTNKTLIVYRIYENNEIDQGILYSKKAIDQGVLCSKKEIYQGILCSKKDFEQFGNKNKIKDINLKNLFDNLFEIDKQYLIDVDNKIFYSSLNLEKRSISIDYVKQSDSQLIDSDEKHLQSENCVEKNKQIVAQNWQGNNQQEIILMNLQLAKIQQDIQNNQSKLDEICNKINQREHFAREAEHKIEQKVSERINFAKKHVADFICEMAFNSNFTNVQNQNNVFYRHGKIITGNVEVQIDNLKDFYDELAIELEIGGVQSENSRDFAIYLTTAYLNDIFLLLAGHNARDIADAFSVTLTGKTAAIFDCSGVNSINDFEIIANSDDEVIAILNPFAPNFTAYLPELLNIDNKFIFALYPFAEDLKIEPRSFYNYLSPILLEFIINKRPAKNYNTKYLSNKIKEYKQNYQSSNIPISAERRIKTLVREMRNFSPEKNTIEFIVYFSLAYVKGQEDKFLETCDNEEISKQIHAFLGED